VKTRPSLAAVLVSGAAALALRGLPHQLGLVTAALAGVTAGVLLERRVNGEKEGSDAGQE